MHIRVLTGLEGVDDLLAHLLRAQLRQHERTAQISVLRSTPPRTEDPGALAGIDLGAIFKSDTFSITYIPTSPHSIGSTGHDPRYTGTPTATRANATPPPAATTPSRILTPDGRTVNSVT